MESSLLVVFQILFLLINQIQEYTQYTRFSPSHLTLSPCQSGCLDNWNATENEETKTNPIL